MTEFFIDTNIFLRFLTNDIPEQAQAVEEVLKRANKGEIDLYTSVLTLAEIVWTLESYYELPREDIRDKVIAILNTPGLHIEEADRLAQAVTLYADLNIDFIDAYNAVWMRDQGLSKVITFDIKHFNRVQWVNASTPEEVQ
jgi:predicted nucleic-acid-binding protein